MRCLDGRDTLTLHVSVFCPCSEQAVVSSPQDHFPNFVHLVVTDMRMVNILVKAMKLSGWIFNMKVRGKTGMLC